MLVNNDPDVRDENQESFIETSESVNKQTRTEKSCLTVTNIPVNVFTSEKVKVVKLEISIITKVVVIVFSTFFNVSLLTLQEIFEELFKQYGDIMSIIYLKSFSRARVIYHNANDAIHAKDELHGFTLEGNLLGVYFTQVEAFIGHRIL